MTAGVVHVTNATPGRDKPTCCRDAASMGRSPPNTTVGTAWLTAAFGTFAFAAAADACFFVVAIMV